MSHSHLKRDYDKVSADKEIKLPLEERPPAGRPYSFTHVTIIAHIYTTPFSCGSQYPLQTSAQHNSIHCKHTLQELPAVTPT